MNIKWTVGALLALTLAVFAEPAWTGPPETWTDKTARQILSSSPWSKSTRPQPSVSQGKIWPTFIIRWESALPVVLAHEKLGNNQSLQGGRGYYTIAVIGPLEQVSTPVDNTKIRAVLKATGKAAVTAAQCRAMRERNGAAVLLFLFPAILDIGEPRRFRLPFGLTSNAWDIEFSVDFGTLKLRQTFPLEEMIYRGSLEL
jgi:hypothetical protein